MGWRDREPEFRECLDIRDGGGFLVAVRARERVP
jgi:hypothetical protein